MFLLPQPVNLSRSSKTSIVLGPPQSTRLGSSGIFLPDISARLCLFCNMQLGILFPPYSPSSETLNKHFFFLPYLVSVTTPVGLHYQVWPKCLAPVESPIYSSPNSHPSYKPLISPKSIFSALPGRFCTSWIDKSKCISSLTTSTHCCWSTKAYLK